MLKKFFVSTDLFPNFYPISSSYRVGLEEEPESLLVTAGAGLDLTTSREAPDSNHLYSISVPRVAISRNLIGCQSDQSDEGLLQ